MEGFLYFFFKFHWFFILEEGFQYSAMGSGNSFAPSMRQAITWTNDDAIMAKWFNIKFRPKSKMQHCLDQR